MSISRRTWLMSHAGAFTTRSISSRFPNFPLEAWGLAVVCCRPVISDYTHSKPTSLSISRGFTNENGLSSIWFDEKEARSNLFSPTTWLRFINTNIYRQRIEKREKNTTSRRNCRIEFRLRYIGVFISFLLVVVAACSLFVCTALRVLCVSKPIGKWRL